MGAVDLIVIGLLVLVALIGWHRGLVRSVLSVAGTIGGAIVASAALPFVLDYLGVLGPAAAAVSIGVLLVGIGLGNALAVFIGRPIWMALQHGPGRVVDAAAGALVSAVAGLIVFWLVAAMVASFPSPTLSSAVPGWSRLKIE